MLADLLLSAPFRPAVAQRISHDLLLVIHQWAAMIDKAGGLDGDYEAGKTWWTVVDVLMSRNWTDDERVKVLQDMANASRKCSLTSAVGQLIRVLTRSLLHTKDSPAEDNLVLILAEQVIGGSSLKFLLPVLNDVVVPICHKCLLFTPYCRPSTLTKSGFFFARRYLNDKSHLEAFESSHSVVLAILNKPLRRSAEGQSPPAVKTFIQALLQNYFGVLLQVRAFHGVRDL